MNKQGAALIENVDLVITRHGESEEEISVFYGRCPHRGAMLADGFVSGKNLMCGVHFWDFRVDTGVSEYNNSEVLPKFAHWVEDGAVSERVDDPGDLRRGGRGGTRPTAAARRGEGRDF